MTAGRDLDALVAERVWPECSVGMAYDHDQEKDVLSVWKWKGERDWVPVPAFSTDIAAAWEVVEKLAQDRMLVFGIEPHNLDGFKEADWLVRWMRLDVQNPQWQESWADTAPLAICLAALKAVGYPVEES